MLRIRHKVGMFILFILSYNALHGLASSYLRDLLVSEISGCTFNFASETLLSVVWLWTRVTGARSFSYYTPHLWNSLHPKLHLRLGKLVEKSTNLGKFTEPLQRISVIMLQEASIFLCLYY